MIAATIRGGVAVSDDFADLPDGTEVGVIAPDVDVELTPAQDEALVERIAEADRGDTLLPAEVVLRDFEQRRLARSGR
jgi:hypothetical protein